MTLVHARSVPFRRRDARPHSLGDGADFAGSAARPARGLAGQDGACDGEAWDGAAAAVAARRPRAPGRSSVEERPRRGRGIRGCRARATGIGLFVCACARGGRGIRGVHPQRKENELRAISKSPWTPRAGREVQPRTVHPTATLTLEDTVFIAEAAAPTGSRPMESGALAAGKEVAKGQDRAGWADGPARAAARRVDPRTRVGR